MSSSSFFLDRGDRDLSSLAGWLEPGSSTAKPTSVIHDVVQEPVEHLPATRSVLLRPEQLLINYLQTYLY